MELRTGIRESGQWQTDASALRHMPVVRGGGLDLQASGATLWPAVASSSTSISP